MLRPFSRQQRKTRWWRFLPGEIEFAFLCLNFTNAIVVSFITTHTLLPQIYDMAKDRRITVNETGWPLLAALNNGSGLVCSPEQLHVTKALAAPLLAYLTLETAILWTDGGCGALSHPRWREIGYTVTPFHIIIAAALAGVLKTSTGCAPFMWCSWSEVSTLLLGCEELLEYMVPRLWLGQALPKSTLKFMTTLSFVVQRVFVFAAVLADSAWEGWILVSTGRNDQLWSQRSMCLVLVGAGLAANLHVTRERIQWHNDPYLTG